jgi:hypothetical protein
VTGPRRSVTEAVDEHDVTRALTPGQLLLLVLGVFLLLRAIRRLRAW